MRLLLTHVVVATLLCSAVPICYAQTPTTTDTTPPVLTVSPVNGPGAMFDGNATVQFVGTVEDSESGVANVVAGTNAVLLTGNNWETVITLHPGVNYVSIVATDTAGNTTKLAFSVLYGPELIAGQTPIADAAKLRYTASAFRAFSGAMTALVQIPTVIPQFLASQFLSRVYTLVPAGSLPVVVKGFTFRNANVVFTPQASGIDVKTTFDYPRLTADITMLGRNQVITFDRLEISCTVHVDVRSGHATTRVSGVQVAAKKPRSPNPLIGLFGTSRRISKMMVEALEQVVPTAMDLALSDAFKAHTITYQQRSLAVQATPQAATFGRSGIDIVLAANAKADRANLVHQGRGSLSRRRVSGSVLPATPTPDTHAATTWFAEDLINRSLFAVWEAGGLDTTIDAALISSLGVQLPVNLLDGRTLAQFFPQLAGMLPATGTVPVAMRTTYDLPPTVIFSNQTPPFHAAAGEVHLVVAVDFGAGLQDVLAVKAHVEAGGNVALQGNRALLQLSTTPLTHYQLTQNPLGLTTSDIDNLIATTTPMLVQVINAALPSLSLSSLPAISGVQPSALGITPSNFQLGVVGPGSDYVEFKSDL